MGESVHSFENTQNNDRNFVVPEEALRHPEAITVAALYMDNKLYWDVSHGHITMNQLSDEQLRRIDTMSTEEGLRTYGYLTTYGRFVDRQAAYELAKKRSNCDQTPTRTTLSLIN